MKRTIAMLLALLLLWCAAGTAGAQETPPAGGGSDYALWQERTRASLTGDLSHFVSADSGALAWGTSYAINAYCRAYQATGEEIYLEKAGGYLYEIFQLAQDKDGDGYKNWGTETYSDGHYEEFCVHTGALLSSGGEWANLVASSPWILDKTEPVSGMPYGALCDYLVDEATRNMIPAFDKDWNDRYGVYTSPAGSTYFGGKTVSLPNNQFLAMAATLIQFAKLSPEHQEEYLRRAARMLETFRRRLWYNCRGDITRWKYRDRYLPCDERPSKEDYSHGMWSVRAATMGYANGLAFTHSNIEAFARVYKSMVRGTAQEPLLTYNVDGSGTKDNALFLFIYDLSPFGDAIWSTGYKTAVARGAPASIGDAARILAYHQAAPAPLPFGLVSPEPGAQIFGRTLLRWEPSVYACKYTLQISDREDFASLFLERADILDTSAFVELPYDGRTLYWQVIAANQGGGSFVSEPSAIVTPLIVP